MHQLRRPRYLLIEGGCEPCTFQEAQFDQVMGIHSIAVFLVLLGEKDALAFRQALIARQCLSRLKDFLLETALYGGIAYILRIEDRRQQTEDEEGDAHHSNPWRR